MLVFMLFLFGGAVMVLGTALIWWITTLNTLIRYRNGIGNANSVLDACLKRRYDLVPDLVESVKRHMAHEQGLLDEVLAARQTIARGAAGPEAEAAMGEILRSFNLMVENYPASRADATVDSLMRSLNEIEEEIRAARQMFSANVTMYNNLVQGVPSRMVANAHGFLPREVFSIPEEERRKTPAWS